MYEREKRKGGEGRKEGERERESRQEQTTECDKQRRVHVKLTANASMARAPLI